MPSQVSRPAAKLSPSQGKKLRDLDKRALDLEKQLSDLEATAAAASGTSRDQLYEKANGLRVPLCEVFSEIILADPSYAVRNNATDRLWRLCFYARIGRLRQRIAKERKKNKASNETGKIKVEEIFTRFLSEAITLYDYLVNRLTTELATACGVPISTKGGGRGGQWSTTTVTSETSSFASQSTAKGRNAQSPEAVKVGIVECLSRLYICLGDLYRYSNNSKQAESCYTTSSKLAPGYGHAFNQLGVTCQTPTGENGSSAGDVPVALTLYWYARALLASHQPSLTTKPNVGRLLRANHDWMTKNQGKVSNTKEEEGSKGKKNSKTQQTRQVLAEFVELHARFFNGVDSENAENENNKGILRLEDKLQTVVASLTKLIQNSALGDSLLCKLVALQAFSECYIYQQNDGGKDSRNKASSAGDNNMMITGNDQHRVNFGTWSWARRTTLLIGAALAERVVAILEKLMESHNKKNSNVKVLPSSVRLLLPLLLVSEYIYHNNIVPEGASEDSGLPHSERLDEAIESFGSKLVAVLNLCSRFVNVVEGSTGLPSKEVDGIRQLKDYRDLRGYGPFAAFISTEDIRDGYVCENEALEILTGGGGSVSKGSNQDSSSVTSQSTNKSNPQTSDQGRIKIDRFLNLGNQLASDRSDSELASHVQRNPEDNSFLWISLHPETKESSNLLVDDDGDVPMNADEDDKSAAGDTISPPERQQITENASVEIDGQLAGSSGSTTASGSACQLLYKQDISGGPALLVPGSLLAHPQPQQASHTPPSGTAPIAQHHLSPALKSSEPNAAAADPVAFGASRLLDDSVLLGNADVSLRPQQQSKFAEQKLGAQQQPSSFASPAAAVLPPPGFSAPSAPAPAEAPLPFVGARAKSSFLSGISDAGRMEVQNQPAPHSLFGQQQPPQQPSAQLLVDSFHLLPGATPSMPTANPFASYSLNSNNGSIIGQGYSRTVPAGEGGIRGDFTHQMITGPSMMDGISFLDLGNSTQNSGDGASSLFGSSLLSSLWASHDESNNSANENTTDNPFAA